MLNCWCITWPVGLKRLIYFASSLSSDSIAKLLTPFLQYRRIAKKKKQYWLANPAWAWGPIASNRPLGLRPALTGLKHISHACHFLLLSFFFCFFNILQNNTFRSPACVVPNCIFSSVNSAFIYRISGPKTLFLNEKRRLEQLLLVLTCHGPVDHYVGSYACWSVELKLQVSHPCIKSLASNQNVDENKSTHRYWTILLANVVLIFS